MFWVRWIFGSLESQGCFSTSSQLHHVVVVGSLESHSRFKSGLWLILSCCVRQFFEKKKPTGGVEPPTFRLQSECSATKLSRPGYRSARGLVVMIVACQVMDPGSIPGSAFLFVDLLLISRTHNEPTTNKRIGAEV